MVNSKGREIQFKYLVALFALISNVSGFKSATGRNYSILACLCTARKIKNWFAFLSFFNSRRANNQLKTVSEY